MLALQPNVATALTETIWESGTKDALVQPVIDHLVKLGQELHKASPTCAACTPDEVLAILTDELKKEQAKGQGILNPLVSMDGKLYDQSCSASSDKV
jgi:hypothetical protein